MVILLVLENLPRWLWLSYATGFLIFLLVTWTPGCVDRRSSIKRGNSKCHQNVHHHHGCHKQHVFSSETLSRKHFCEDFQPRIFLCIECVNDQLQEFCQAPSRFWYWLWKRHASYLKTFAGRVARNVSMPASLSLQFDWWGHRLHCSIVWSGVELSLSVYTSPHNYFCLLLSSGFQEPCTQCHIGGAHAATARSTEIKSVR